MKLQWDKTGEKLYKTGVDQVALFKQKPDGTYDHGVAWSGVTSIESSRDGGDENDFFADNIKYLSLRGFEDEGGSITAYQSPEEFDECDGEREVVAGFKARQQVRMPFGLVYRNIVGNDTMGNDFACEYHFIYNATASPSTETHDTVSDSPEPTELSWDYSTTPIASGLSIPLEGNETEPLKPSSHYIIETKKFTTAAQKTALQTLLDKVYGTDNSEPELPTPAQIYAMLS